MSAKPMPKKERQMRLSLAENGFLLCAACPYAVQLVKAKKIPVLLVRCRKHEKPLQFVEATGCRIYPKLRYFPGKD